MEIIFATGNKNKMKEIREILGDLEFNGSRPLICSMKEKGIEADIVEDGNSFIDNALIKARAVAALLRDEEGLEKNSAVPGDGKTPGDAEIPGDAETPGDARFSSENSAGETYIVMADDSGLEVDYLNGEPGIYSARYMGEDTPYHLKNQNIIDRLKDAVGPERSARFVCAIALILPDGRELKVQETMEGRIGYEERGEGGFGYDPIFMAPPYELSNAELSAEGKNAISHRGKALRAAKKLLDEIKYEDIDSK